MRVELKEKERLELSELYLRRYAIIKDIETLQRQIAELQQEIMTLNQKITKRQDALLKARKIKAKSVQPVFENYSLVGLEVEEDEPAS